MTTGIILLLVGLGLVFVVGPMLGFNLGFNWLKQDPAPKAMPTAAMSDAGAAAAQYAAGQFPAGVPFANLHPSDAFPSRSSGSSAFSQGSTQGSTATGPAPQFLATPQA